jgi:hypothetical protein
VFICTHHGLADRPWRVPAPCRAGRRRSVGSVFGVYLAGLAVAVYSAVWARRAAVSPRPGAGGGEVTSQIHGGQFTSLGLQGRDMHADPATASPDQPGTGTAGAGAVSNRIEDGTFGGPVIQGSGHARGPTPRPVTPVQQLNV